MSVVVTETAPRELSASVLPRPAHPIEVWPRFLVEGVEHLDACLLSLLHLFTVGRGRGCALGLVAII